MPHRRNTLVTILMRTPINPTTGCWEWTGYKNKQGYGQVQYEGKLHLTHRLLYQKLNKVELSRDEFVCHRCDNPLCNNLEHLFIGSHWDNMQDMVNKHRYGNRVITIEQRNEIIKLREGGLTQGQVARQLGIAKGVVSNATRGRVSNQSIPTPAVKVRLQSDKETLEFSSIKQAAKNLGVAHCSITNARRFGAKVKGFSVEYI